MSTPPPPPSSPSPPGPGPNAGDGRDLRVAGLLEVPPLDDLTRVRLVRAALGASEAGTATTDRAPGWRHPPRLLAIAAALLVVLAVGVAVLVPRNANDTDPTAIGARPEASTDAGEAKARDAAPTSGAASTDQAGSLRAAPESTVSSGAAALVLPSLGDLGDVTTGPRLARAVRARLAGSSGAAVVALDGCAAEAANALGTPVAAGSGTVDGRRVVVVVASAPSGPTVALAVRGRSCERRVSADLG